MEKPGQKKAVGANSGASSFDFDGLQEQLLEFSEQENGIRAMLDLINDAKKSKLSPEDRTIQNIAGLISPFMNITNTSATKVKKLQVAVDKNKLNLRLLAYHNDKLEQYTRRDNLHLFNFPLCDDGTLRAKFIKLAAVLGVTLHDHDINIIHKLTASARSQSVIVCMNNRKLRNGILYAKKGPLNVESAFKGVFIQEDLSNQRLKLLKFIKCRDNVDRVQTSDGRLRVTLKEDCGTGRRVIVEKTEDLCKIGVDSADITQFGYIDV